jgi:hypothetical protein
MIILQAFKYLRKGLIAAVVLLTFPTFVFAEPTFQWLDDWDVRFIEDSPEYKGGYTTMKAFGASANNGQITNVGDDRALLRSYAKVDSVWGESSRAKDKKVIAKRSFRLPDVSNVWKVDLKGQLEGVLTSSGKALHPFARIWYDAQIRNSEGVITHTFNGYQEAEDKAKFISGESTLDSQILPHGDYEVTASLMTQGGVDGTVPFISQGAAADFYNKAGEGIYKDVKPGPKGWWVSISPTVPYFSNVTILTLDDVPITQCGETWMESGVVLSIIETTEQDCGGGGDCSFGINYEPGVIWLWPARLNLDFSNLTSLTDNPILVEVDIYDACYGCTRAFLYDDGCTIDSADAHGHSETLLLFGGPGADQLSVSSCEGGVYEIRLTPNPIVNNMVDFTPIPGTYVTIPFTNDFPPSECGCPDTSVGLFSFQAVLENTSCTSLTDLTVKVHTLTNENLLVLARGNSLPEDFVGAETGGEGALWTLPASGNYHDGILDPTEVALPRFGICLKEMRKFVFYVDVLGKVQ